MIKNNVKNIALSMSEVLSMKTKYLKLEIRIIWEGDSILKIYTNINELIEINKQKLNHYNNLQSQMENTIKKMKKDLYNIAHANTKIKNYLSNQIQIHKEVKKITEEKFRHLSVLNKTIYVTEERLASRLGLS